MKKALGKLSSLGADPATIMLGGIRIAMADPTPPAVAGLRIGEPTLADLSPNGVVAAVPVLRPVPEPPPAVETPVEMRLQQTLTFEVEVRGGTPAGVMQELGDIEARVRDADLSGVKQIEAHRAEEDATSEAPGRPCLCGMGVPRLDHIRWLTTSEHISLVKKAVADASRNVEIMALAVGGAIDGVVSIESSTEALANGPSGDLLDVEPVVDVVVRFRVHRVDGG
jgi:hypothetical protein